MGSLDKQYDLKGAGETASDHDWLESEARRSVGKSNLFIVVSDNEDLISSIKALAFVCIELEHPIGEGSLALQSLFGAPQLETLRARLTERQFAIALGVVRGLSNKGIGRELGISHFTVRNHLSRILLILGASNRQELGQRLRALMVPPT